MTNHPNRSRKLTAERRAMIGGMMVTASLPFIVYGPTRGLVSSHRSIAAAKKSYERDHAGCRKQGGYSDAEVYDWNGDHWSVPGAYNRHASDPHPQD